KMAKMYYDKDADIELLKGRTVAVMGYGSQGHAQAQNLKEAGIDVVVGPREDSSRCSQALAAGLKVMTVAEAAKASSVIQILLPDEVQRAVYEAEIKPFLEAGDALVFFPRF
ncbi:ketol-acid reductoisomerase, partial [Candidatus Hakubella thermalkaliphila]